VICNAIMIATYKQPSKGQLWVTQIDMTLRFEAC